MWKRRNLKKVQNRACFKLVWTRPRHSGASRNLDVGRYVRSLDSGLRRNDKEHVQTKLKHDLDSGLCRNDDY